jgi:hypothetical protein
MSRVRAVFASRCAGALNISAAVRQREKWRNASIQLTPQGCSLDHRRVGDTDAKLAGHADDERSRCV